MLQISFFHNVVDSGPVGSVKFSRIRIRIVNGENGSGQKHWLKLGLNLKNTLIEEGIFILSGSINIDADPHPYENDTVPQNRFSENILNTFLFLV